VTEKELSLARNCGRGRQIRKRTWRGDERKKFDGEKRGGCPPRWRGPVEEGGRYVFTSEKRGRRRGGGSKGLTGRGKKRAESFERGKLGGGGEKGGGEDNFVVRAGKKKKKGIA